MQFPGAHNFQNCFGKQPKLHGAIEITAQTDSAAVLAGRSATAAMWIRVKYIHSLGICATPNMFTGLQKEPSDSAFCAVPDISSRMSSCSTSSHSGSRRARTSSSSRSGGSNLAEEDGIVCSSACSACSDDSSEDADTWPRRRCKACLLRGSSLWPVLQLPPKSQTVSIFDWDDTLLCTSVLAYTSAWPGYPPLPPTWLLADIARAASDLLEAACRLGPTFIITNATVGWVEASAQRWVPGLLPALGKVNEIISARSRYESQEPDINHWKLLAFLELQRSLDPHPVTNIIAVGDSDHEINAARAMANHFARAVVKTVKFKPIPMPLDLLRQLELFREKLDQIVEAGSNLQLKLYRKVPHGPQEAHADS